jgi:hypothetical protein
MLYEISATDAVFTTAAAAASRAGRDGGGKRGGAELARPTTAMHDNVYYSQLQQLHDDFYNYTKK